MTAPSKRITAITKSRPDHISLDFDRLRAEGIQHLENLATEIWTDFNAHDPGITTMEVLCYAITDLAYRTRMLPIQDLAAGNTHNKPWFEAYEILPSRPVTVNDLRRLLIDVDGVKNAWVERMRPSDPVFVGRDGKKWFLKAGERKYKLIENADGNLDKSQLLNWAKPFFEDEKKFDEFASFVNKQLDSTIKIADAVSIFEASILYPDIAEKMECQLGHFPIEAFVPTQGEVANDALTNAEMTPLPLNGIHRVRLELDDHLDPDNSKHIQRAVRQALARLHDNRGLCEDFLRPEVVDNWCYCLCLDIETDPAANERDIAAEILYRIQEFLVPTVRFRTFKEMRQLGIPCDQIFNGPLLTNGFIAEADLEASIRLPRYIYRSDLLRIAAEVPGVLDVRDLRLKGPIHDAHTEAWQIPVVPLAHALADKSAPYPTDPDAADYPPGNLKPLLDACCSKITIWRNGLRQVFTGPLLEEQYNALRVARMSIGSGTGGGPDYPAGAVRPDLADYQSIQYDYPANYMIGANQPSPQRRAGSLQIQAYLLFYDQLLAGYLTQLGRVRELFAVQQDPEAPTASLPTLFDAPGAQALMGEFARLTFPLQARDAVGDAALREVQNVEKTLVDLRVNLHAAEAEELKRHIRARIAGAEARIGILQQLAPALQPFIGQVFEKMSLLSAALRSTLGNDYAVFGPLAENAAWQVFVADKNNNIVQAVGQIADPPARRMDRRNRLLDHLIARFGESFSDYVASLVRSDAAPEDNPWRQDFAEYLRDKARFLATLPESGAERGRGYNYRLLNGLHQPDVWNSSNVAGLQKRVSRLLGIDSGDSRSVLGTFPYRLDTTVRNTRQGSPIYHIHLVRREQAEPSTENPLRRGPLLSSAAFHSKDEVAKASAEIYLSIGNSAFYSLQTDPENDDFSLVEFNDGHHKLSSRSLPEGEAVELQEAILSLVSPRSSSDREGFHLVEHILLRPDDERDNPLLQLPLGCDPDESPRDPYSFWLTVVLPNWTGRFRFTDFQGLVEQTFRREAPAHIALRFCWLDRDQMLEFEVLLKKWMEEKARCEPNNCNVTDVANAIVTWLSEHPCNCFCAESEEPKSAC